MQTQELKMQILKLNLQTL